MAADLRALGVLSLLWLGYGIVHSLTAGRRFKAWAAGVLPGLAHVYRLAYNLVALLLLVPILLWMARHPGVWVWRWEGLWGWLADGMGLLAAGTLALGPGQYDLREFLGLRAFQERRPLLEDQDPFRIASLHRFVRHPWYALSLGVLWTRDMNEARLISAVWITLYILVGSRLEEAKLEARFGERYRRYRARVPALLPWPWKWLDRNSAAALVRGDMGEGSGDIRVN